MTDQFPSTATSAGSTTVAEKPQGGRSPRPPRLILVGNPNAGKTTLFNQLTGASAKVGNFPGITVEVEHGTWRLPNGTACELADLPGTYSLTSSGDEAIDGTRLDERVAVLATAGLPPLERPDAIVLVIDGTEMARQLYLALQVRELGVPTVLAVTMLDVLERDGASLDLEELITALGLPVVGFGNVSRQESTEALGHAVERALEGGRLEGRRGEAADDTERASAAIEQLSASVPSSWSGGDELRAREIARLTLIQAEDDLTPPSSSGPDGSNARTLDERRRLEQQAAHLRAAARSEGIDLEEELIAARYRWIDERLERFHKTQRAEPFRGSDRIDRILLHPVFGFAIFAVIMTVAFQALFAGADPFIGWIETGVAWLADGTQSLLPESLFREFLVSGVIEGVGAVVVFLPQIILIFLLLGLLEDTGYMARVVYLIDRVMRAVGLNGRAFIPMLSGFACAVPAILSTRTMERRRDRLLTILIVPLMTCSARLPVYGLLIAAIYPVGEESTFGQGALMAAMYLFSLVAAMGMAGVLGRTLLKSKPAALVQQIPPYRKPVLSSVLRSMQRRVGIFLKDAGTVILACTVLMWVLLSFPRNSAEEQQAEQRANEAQTRIEQQAEDPDSQVDGPEVDGAEAEGSGAEGTRIGDSELAALESAQASARLRNSYAARMGRGIEPVIEPLGFDWQIGVGLLGAFAAREVFVSTMAVVYGLDEGEDEESQPLRKEIRDQKREDGSKLYTARTCLSLMVFFALACQCLSTVAAAKRETGGYRWPIFMMVYMTVLAWGTSFVTYQGMGLLGFE